MAWRRNLQVSSVGTSAERLGVGADHDGGRAAGAKGAATEETRKGLRLRILPGTGCHRAGPPSKSGARAGGGRSDDFTQSNCGGTEAELATSATTCLHPQPPSRAYICVRNHPIRAIALPNRAAAFKSLYRKRLLQRGVDPLCSRRLRYNTLILSRSTLETVESDRHGWPNDLPPPRHREAQPRRNGRRLQGGGHQTRPACCPEVLSNPPCFQPGSLQTPQEITFPQTIPYQQTIAEEGLICSS